MASDGVCSHQPALLVAGRLRPWRRSYRDVLLDITFWSNRERGGILSPVERFRRLLTDVALSLILTACVAHGGSSSVDSTGSAEALQAAAEKTLGAESFHVEASYEAPPGQSGTGTVAIDFQAPDRTHERSGDGTDAHEMITIGSIVYVSNRLGHFWLVTGKSAGETPPLVWLRFTQRAENVRYDDSTYRFDVRPPTPGIEKNASARGEATISDGFIGTLKYRLTYLDGTAFSLTYVFSAFNSGITVNPPPDEQVDS
jgi:hypothetical protein